MRNKKWLTMLLALVVSVIIWVYIVTVENPEREATLFNIPVTFSGEDILREDYDLIIAETNVESGVTLDFNGKLSELNKLRDEKMELEVTVDVSRLRSANEFTFSYDLSNVTLPASVSSQSLSLIGRTPNKISVTLAKLESKTVEVKVVTDVKTVDGYLAERATQNYSEIVIEGPADVINQVDYALVSLTRENVDQTITTSLPYTLIDYDGNVVDSTDITSDVTEIEVTQPISMFKVVPLEILTIDGGGATQDDCVIQVEPETIQISGEASILETIQSIRLSSVDLSSMMSNSETFTRVITVPDGCTNLSGVQEATVKVQIKNKAIRQVRIPSANFQFINQPAGIQPESTTTMLLVAIRANEADIDLISEENIRVVADLSSFTAANAGTTVTVPVRIYLDGFEDAGVIQDEEYSIIVDLNAVGEN